VRKEKRELSFSRGGKGKGVNAAKLKPAARQNAGFSELYVQTEKGKKSCTSRAGRGKGGGVLQGRCGGGKKTNFLLEGKGGNSAIADRKGEHKEKRHVVEKKTELVGRVPRGGFVEGGADSEGGIPHTGKRKGNPPRWPCPEKKKGREKPVYAGGGKHNNLLGKGGRERGGNHILSLKSW